MRLIYKIEGVSCGACVAKINSVISRIPQVNEFSIDPKTNILSLNTLSDFDINNLKKTLNEIGGYSLSQINSPGINEQAPRSFISVYKPLLITIAFIGFVCAIVQFPFVEFSFGIFMRHFMAGFFIVFSFFKLLDLNGFVKAFKMYDLLANRFNIWAYFYPFIELLLGVLFLLGVYATHVSLATIIVLSISTIGVVNSNLKKEKIQCACLGSVFNLPMSKVTIIENLSMIVMALIMLS